MKKNVIGKKAYIKSNIDSIHAGGWGEIIFVDKDGYYHVAMYGDKDYCPIFTRDEIVIRK